MSPDIALNYLLSQLLNQAQNFRILASQTLEELNTFFEATVINQEIALNFILRHINQSDYAARLMEIAMHSLMQAMQDYQVFSNSSLKPLSQMRSANKKHGNVGDIELSEKLEVHSAIRRAGFVTSLEPERLDGLEPRCEEIEEIYGISLEILTFAEWVEEQFERASTEETASEQELTVAWIAAYAESLAQLRRDIAPIDEPCYQWLLTLRGILTEEL